MIAAQNFPPDLLADCTDDDAAQWRESLARIGSPPASMTLACISVDREDFRERIAARVAAGRIALCLATRSRTRQRREALNAGAAEFLETGPIDPARLAARLNLLIRGSALPQDLSIAAGEARVVIGGICHRLSAREFALFACLHEAKGGFVTHEVMLRRLWTGKSDDRQRLRVAINGLRKRIEPEPDMPRYLLNEPAIGYRLGTGAIIAS